MEQLCSYIDRRVTDDGIIRISEARPYDHAEEAYDEQYAVDKMSADAIAQEAAALTAFLQTQQVPAGATVLEIGCGTGRLSVSLARQPEIDTLLITDPSEAFLAITRRKLLDIPGSNAKVSLGVLRAEDVGLLPEDSTTVIILRSVLHHILDVERFLTDCARVLAHGGILVCEEPYYEGYMLMGAMAQFIPLAVAASGQPWTTDDQQHVDTFVAAMKYYCRRDLDKSQGEDKHLFRPDELIATGWKLGLQLRHLPNWRITVGAEQNLASRIGYFERFFHDYCLYCMSWPAPLVQRSKSAMRSHFEFFQGIESPETTIPNCFGTFVFRKL